MDHGSFWSRACGHASYFVNSIESYVVDEVCFTVQRIVRASHVVNSLVNLYGEPAIIHLNVDYMRFRRAILFFGTV